jgi:transposase
MKRGQLHALPTERRKRGGRIDPSGYDAGKKINGKKRHILVDTQGLLMRAIVHAANVQDRDGGALLMATLFGAFPFLTRLFADGGYQGPQFKGAIRRTLAAVTVEIVKRSDARTFVVLPKRWVVERTLAWLGRCRRLARDWECLNHKALAFLRLASIRLMLRKLCNPSAPRGRGSSVEVGSTRIIVGWSGSWQAAWQGNRPG